MPTDDEKVALVGTALDGAVCDHCRKQVTVMTTKDGFFYIHAKSGDYWACTGSRTEVKAIVGGSHYVRSSS